MKNPAVFQRRLVKPFALTMCFLCAGSVMAEETPVPKIGIINVGRLLEESAAGQAALVELRNLREQKAAEATAQEEEIKSLRDRINEGSLSLSEERLAAMRKELEDKVIAYQRFQDDAQRDFQKRQVDIFESIQNRVMPVITAAGEEHGYTLIFNKFESGLVFAVDEVDITDLILERFNQVTEPGSEATEEVSN
jgi:outer membrane protein